MPNESCKTGTHSLLIGQCQILSFRGMKGHKSLIFAKFLFSTGSQPPKVNVSIDQIQSTAVSAIRLNAFLTPISLQFS